MGSVSILRRASVVASGAALLFAAGLGSVLGQAQAPAKAATTSAASTGRSARPEVPAKKHIPTAGKRHKAKAPEPPPVVETRPPDPPPPDWPVNDQARPASVAWNGRDLSIVATNSSLDQILHEVSTATGVKIDGLAASHGGANDQRVYGHYGPASARDVLSQLLEGSGYNVIMVGDRGEGTPRQLVLTTQAGEGKGAAAGETHVTSNGEEEAEEPEQPEQQPEQPFHRQFNGQTGEPAQPGPGIRTPQQMLQELQQQRQQQQQQQQQQLQQAQPAQPQNN